MKKILLSSMLVCVLIASMLILAGCGKDKLAGKWSDAVDDMYNATFEFAFVSTAKIRNLSYQ